VRTLPTRTQLGPLFHFLVMFEGLFKYSQRKRPYGVLSIQASAALFLVKRRRKQRRRCCILVSDECPPPNVRCIVMVTVSKWECEDVRRSLRARAKHFCLESQLKCRPGHEGCHGQFQKRLPNMVCVIGCLILAGSFGSESNDDLE
jgi:hypothetical protein